MRNSIHTMLGEANKTVKHRELLPTPNNRVRRKKHKMPENGSMSLQERINELFDENPDKKAAELARFAKISRGAVSDWRSGETKTIAGKNAVAVAKFFGVNVEWVQDGKGPKRSVKKVTNESYVVDIKGSVPLIGWVQAGAWCDAVDNYAAVDAESWWPCPVKHGKHTYALRVQGDSMTNPYPGQRSYPEGSIIFVDPDVQAHSGLRVIAKIAGSNEVTFKEYRCDSGKHYLKPLNPQYQTIEIEHETHFCGVVIGKFEPE